MMPNSKKLFLLIMWLSSLDEKMVNCLLVEEFSLQFNAAKDFKLVEFNK
jgi:hypothetical protein